MLLREQGWAPQNVHPAYILAQHAQTIMDMELVLVPITPLHQRP